MQRQRGELVPIGEAFSGLDAGPLQAIRGATPQARHSFTVADQVNQLINASEADPDLGFMARTMALCSLPRSNPGNRIRYVRRNGPYTLYMTAGGGKNKLANAILEGIIKRAQAGELDAVNWLEERGLLKLPSREVSKASKAAIESGVSQEELREAEELQQAIAMLTEEANNSRMTS